MLTVAGTILLAFKIFTTADFVFASNASNATFVVVISLTHPDCGETITTIVEKRLEHRIDTTKPVKEGIIKITGKNVDGTNIYTLQVTSSAPSLTQFTTPSVIFPSPTGVDDTWSIIGTISSIMSPMFKFT